MGHWLLEKLASCAPSFLSGRLMGAWKAALRRTEGVIDMAEAKAKELSDSADKVRKGEHARALLAHPGFSVLFDIIQTSIEKEHAKLIAGEANSEHYVAIVKSYQWLVSQILAVISEGERAAKEIRERSGK
jgi:hypothetical protein